MKKMFWLWIVGLGLFLTMVTLAQAPPNPLSVAGFEPITDYVPNQVLVLVNLNKLTPTSLNPPVALNKLITNLVIALRNQGLRVPNPYDIPRNFRGLGVDGIMPNEAGVCGGTLLTVTSPTWDVDTLLRIVNLAVQRFIATAGYQGDQEAYMIIPNDVFTRPDGEMPSPANEPFTSLNDLTAQVQGVKIAVIDSGFFMPVSPRIPHLPGFTTIQDSTTASRPYDTRPPSSRGWDVDRVRIEDNTPRSPTNNVPRRPTVYGHGTPVLGIIDYIARGATFIPIKACNNLGYCTGKSVTLGLCYAAYQRADVINASFGGFFNSPLVFGAVNDAMAVGSLVVAGAGNSRNLAWFHGENQAFRNADDLNRGWNKPVYPAAWSHLLLPSTTGFRGGMLSVGSISPSPLETISSFSTLIDSVDVVTYGENIKTLHSLNASFNGFSDAPVLRSGTSFSAPIIAGVAAVMKYNNPRDTAADIASRIANSPMSEYECVLDMSRLPEPLNECRTPLSGSLLPRVKVKKLNFDSLGNLITLYGVVPVAPGRPN
jgi:subtilisin family serine protease